jgi:5-methylcytosine-specific restriction protein A
MAKLKDITREDMLRAITECDELGREAFLSKYGFKPGKRFFIKHNRRTYDSKAIVGVAAGLAPNEFSGGAATIGPVCRRTEFKLEERSG